MGALDAGVGATLRALRRKSRLSLAAVAARSGGEFKASSLGAYERGDRALSVGLLHKVANLYGVTAEQLIRADPATVVDIAAIERAERSGLVLDVAQIRADAGPQSSSLTAFAKAITEMRSGAPPSVLTVRRSDAAMLAAILACDPNEVAAALRERFSPDSPRRDPAPL